MSSIAAAVGRLALDVDLPGAAEQVEVVDVGAAEHRLQRVEDVARPSMPSVCTFSRSMSR